MRDKYPYLRDPRALAEIRKHKWIESQKKGEEIGFATAAVDWVKKYGEEWKHIHVYKDNSIFIEKRKYRRFKINFKIDAIRDNVHFIAESINLNFFGLLFRTTKDLSVGNEVRIGLPTQQNRERILSFHGTVERVFAVNQKQYEIFLKFNSNSQREIEDWQFIHNL